MELERWGLGSPVAFPIKRCHQRVVTFRFLNHKLGLREQSFQSKGVTNEW